ncbi:hypothetical protein [Streptomyces sp. NPDC059994]|uniref:hypothetical protein n=1 Tax=Streptomyces sp. NPDC059994 TaxID=3347029 RepID=UPI00369B3002
MKRTDAIRLHSEEAASYSKAAESAAEPARTQLREAANDHQVMADAARLYDYEWEELED